MPSHRKERVRELLKRAIGEAIRREIPVGQAGLISVNDVELGGDLRSARVFVSILGDAEQQRTGMVTLQRSRPRLQDLVAKAVVLKYTPHLRFVVDDSVARGDHILHLLEELERTTPGP
jgi:ribosome-binding factor A